MTFADRIRSLTLATTLLAAACGTVNQGPVEAKQPVGGDVRQVAEWMAGTFASTAQSARDPQFRDVVLHIAPMWIDQPDARWFYVEQAMANAQDKPYRQRVYRLTEAGDGVESMIFELPGDPLQYAGAWRAQKPLDQLLPSMLVPKAGCAVRLKRADGQTWTGGTDGQGCPSSREGAAYTTSEVTLTATELRSWDRGFDAKGKQVWGSTAGPYIFVKETGK
jgi:hypothetical protein